MLKRTGFRMCTVLSLQKGNQCRNNNITVLLNRSTKLEITWKKSTFAAMNHSIQTSWLAMIVYNTLCTLSWTQASRSLAVIWLAGRTSGNVYMPWHNELFGAGYNRWIKEWKVCTALRLCSFFFFSILGRPTSWVKPFSHKCQWNSKHSEVLITQRFRGVELGKHVCFF